MAVGWDAADDDLEKLLDFDDLEVPTFPESCKAMPSIDAKEDGMESSGRDGGVHDSSAIASVPATFAIASRVDKFTASMDSALVSSKTSHLGTQLVVTPPNGPDEESFRERNGEDAGDGGYVDTQRVGSAFGSEKADAVPKGDRQQRRIAGSTVDSFAEVRPHKGFQDAGLAVYDEVAAVCPASDAPDETEILQATNCQRREEWGSCHQVGRKEIGSKVVPEAVVGLGTEFNVCSNKSTCRTEQALAGSFEKGSCEGLPYRIPGPAGALQENYRKRTASGDLKHRRRSFGSDSQSDTTEFLETPWITAMRYLDGEASKRVPTATIGGIKGLGRHFGHIPELVVIIKALVPNGVGDASVVLKVKHLVCGQGVKISKLARDLGISPWFLLDPTGTINGCIHRSVLTESKYGHGVIPGAVLILRKVTVFSPNPDAHYLNITTENVHKVFRSEAGNGRPQTRVAKEMTNNVQGNKTVSSDDPIEVLPATVSISQRVGEPVIRPSVEQGKLQAAVCNDANHDNTGVRYEISAKKPISLGTAKGLLDGSLDRTLEGRGAHPPVINVDLRNRGGSARNPLQVEPPEARNTQDSEEKTTQEAVTAAKAKAAGWDLGEDVELLLNDDLSSFLI